MSLALRDPATPAVAPQLGFVAGVALVQALRGLLDGDRLLKLKWPNDILYDGAKLAGMLLESSMLPGGSYGCVIGIGVNCRSHPDGLAYPATDLEVAGASNANPDSILADFTRGFDIHLKQWDRGAGFAAVRLAWLAMAAGLGERIVGRDTPPPSRRHLPRPRRDRAAAARYRGRVPCGRGRRCLLSRPRGGIHELTQEARGAATRVQERLSTHE